MNEIDRLRNIGARLAGCLWGIFDSCPECGNQRINGHMDSCTQVYEKEFKSPADFQKVFDKAFNASKLEDKDTDMNDKKRWESHLYSCTYNAVVNYGSNRERKKMVHLIKAINMYEREKGKRKMKALIKLGVIKTYTPCHLECCVRPGGLFHVKGCENDPNHPVYKERQKKAKDMVPAGKNDAGGWYAASVILVGE